MSLEEYKPKKFIEYLELDYLRAKKIDENNKEVITKLKKILRINFLKVKKQEIESENYPYTIEIDDEGEFTVN